MNTYFTIAENLATLATLENAKAYEAENDKWLFCHYLIESYLDIRATDGRIEMLENMFDKVLGKGK
jgi:hypothetical protein